MKPAVLLLVLATALAVSHALPVPHAPAPRKNDLVEAITAERLLAHLDALQRVGDAYGDRAVGAGYNASAAYAMTLLAATPLRVSLEHFVVPVWSQIDPASLELRSPLEISFREGQDFGHQRYGGSGEYSVTGRVDFISNGCSGSDFANFTTGNIAMVQTGGDCEDFIKAFHAEDAGAAALFVHAAPGSSGFPTSRVRDTEWAYPDRLVELPVIALTYTVGQTLRNLPDNVVSMTANAKTELHPTYNVLAETFGGNPEKTIVVGGHMDSVPGTAGINDNGSGSMAVLELALQFSLLRPSTVNKVVFALWGAEEIGLLGSRHFVRELGDAGRRNIALNLNHDMLSSPNGVRLIHNHADAPLPAQPVSRLIQETYEEFYQANDLPYELTSMTGGSDFLPFLLADIPAGGLATGAGQLKSIEQRKIYGGLANTAMDTCYHEPCDDMDNVDVNLFVENTQALAYTLDALASNPNL